MIPPRSFVSSVYCASPGSIRPRSFESSRLEQLARPRPLDLELAHVRDVERAGVLAHCAVLRDHALVLDGHLPAGERHHARAERDVAVVQRRAAERLHRRGCYSDAARRSRQPLRAAVLRLRSQRPAERPVRADVERLSGDGELRACDGALARDRRRSRDRRLGDAAAGAPAGAAAPVALRRSPWRSRSRAPRRPSPWSITAPKMTFAFGSAAAVTTSAASFTSNRPMSGPPVTLSRIPVAPSIDDSSSGDETAMRAASAARFSPAAVPIPISAEPASRMIVRTSAKSRLTSPGR